VLPGHKLSGNSRSSQSSSAWRCSSLRSRTTSASPVIDWVARWLVIPGGIISLVIAGFCAIWRPDYMMRGIYSFIVCLALLFVIKSADFLVKPAAAGTGSEVSTMPSGDRVQASRREEPSAWPITRTGRFAVGAVAFLALTALSPIGAAVVSGTAYAVIRLGCEAAPRVRAALDLVDGSTRSWRRPPVWSRALPHASLPVRTTHREGCCSSERRRVELSLAEAVPLLRRMRDEGVTALITPALDYVGGLEARHQGRPLRKWRGDCAARREPSHLIRPSTTAALSCSCTA